MEEEKFNKYLDSNKYEVKTYYSVFGWFLLTFIGMSAIPISADIIDKSTGKQIENITDEKFLKKLQEDNLEMK